MPGMDGCELARALRSRPSTRHIPIVFSTAHYGPEEIRPLADACAVRDVIFKPAHPTTVLATIDALLVPGQVSVLPADRLAETQRLTRSGTWELDPDTKTVVLLPELRDLLRLPSTRVALEELTLRVHPDDVAGFTTAAENTWCTGSPGIAELRVSDADGVVHELIVSVRTTSVPALWGVAQDVTQARARAGRDPVIDGGSAGPQCAVARRRRCGAAEASSGRHRSRWCLPDYSMEPILVVGDLRAGRSGDSFGRHFPGRTVRALVVAGFRGQPV